MLQASLKPTKPPAVGGTNRRLLIPLAGNGLGHSTSPPAPATLIEGSLIESYGQVAGSARAAATGQDQGPANRKPPAGGWSGAHWAELNRGQSPRIAKRYRGRFVPALLDLSPTWVINLNH